MLSPQKHYIPTAILATRLVRMMLMTDVVVWERARIVMNDNSDDDSADHDGDGVLLPLRM